MADIKTVAQAVAASGKTPNPDYSGPEMTDDFILGIRTSSEQESPEDYTVCQNRISEHSAALNTSTSTDTYIRTGPSTSKTAATRSFAINGHRCPGNPFQDFALSHKMIYALGADAEVDYVYFSLRTGKGETGRAALIVTADGSGAAGNKAGFAITLEAVETPKAYTYNA